MAITGKAISDIVRCLSKNAFSHVIPSCCVHNLDAAGQDVCDSRHGKDRSNFSFLVCSFGRVGFRWFPTRTRDVSSLLGRSPIYSSLEHRTGVVVQDHHHFEIRVRSLACNFVSRLGANFGVKETCKVLPRRINICSTSEPSNSTVLHESTAILGLP